MPLILLLLFSFMHPLYAETPENNSRTLSSLPTPPETPNPTILKTEGRPFPRDRIFSVAIGFGLPQLLLAQAQGWLYSRWQVGFGYGLVPGFNPSLSIADQTFKILDNKDGTVSATPKASLSTWNPFIRFFPADDNFYIQYMHTMLRIDVNVPARVAVQDISDNLGLVTGKVLFTQHLPTLSVGHFWQSNLWFVNVTLGASFFWLTTTSTEIDGFLPEGTGTVEERQQALDRIEKEFESNVVKSMDGFKTLVKIIPSVSLTFGYQF